MAIQVKKITLLPADIFAMFVTPMVGLPAPTAGSVHNILGVSNEKAVSTIPYTGASAFIYGANPSTSLNPMIDSQVLGQIIAWSLPAQRSLSEALPYSTTFPFMITTDLQAASGDGTIILYIIFEEKTFSI